MPARPLGLVGRVDDFEILGELGEGALAVVYLAHQVSLGRQIALKVTAARSGEVRPMLASRNRLLAHAIKVIRRA